MTGHVGAKLRAWRLARGLSLGALAIKTGVHSSTLSRWEAGKRQPSLYELDATLDALGVSHSQRREALQRVDAPRAVQRVRGEGGPSVGGDLLRAMRVRQGWTQEQTAASIAITQSTLAKWERSEDWPATERLQALCYALQAHPEEVAALTTHRFWMQDGSEARFAYETYREHSHDIYMQNDTLRDLRFFSLEATLWRSAGEDDAARSLLRLAYAHHARAMMETRRFSEAEALYRRWQKESKSSREEVETYPQMMVVAAELAGRRDSRRAIGVLREAAQNVQDSDYLSWLLGDLGIYLTQIGDFEAALKVSGAAYQVARRSVYPHTAWFRQRDQARALLAAKRYEDAMKALAAASPLLQISADGQARYLLLEVECWLGLGQPSEAQARLDQVQQVIATQELPYLSPQVDALALRIV